MLRGAHTHVVLPGFTPAAWLKAVEEYRVTSTIAVPTQISRILDDPGYRPERLASMRLLLYGAAPSTRRQLLRMRDELSCGLYHGYGLTEACTVVTALTATDHRGLTGRTTRGSVLWGGRYRGWRRWSAARMEPGPGRGRWGRSRSEAAR